MTSADELFRSYAAAFEANEDPSRAQYVEQLEGPERYALEDLANYFVRREF